MTSKINSTSERNDTVKRANSTAPVYLGGLIASSGEASYWPGAARFPRSLNGCVKKLLINGELYDLASPMRANNTAKGCRGDSANRTLSPVDDNRRCSVGELVMDERSGASCECPPGIVGKRCEEVAPWIQFLTAQSNMNFDDINATVDDVYVLIALSSSSSSPSDGDVLSALDDNNKVSRERESRRNRCTRKR